MTRSVQRPGPGDGSRWCARFARAVGAVFSVIALRAPCARAETSPESLVVHASVVASYSHASVDQDRLIVGRLYGNQQDQFMLESVFASVEQAPRAGIASAGFSVRGVAGSAASAIKAAGLDLGPQADLTQALVIVGIPAGRGQVQLLLGKMLSLLGVEGVETLQNPNHSLGTAALVFENFTDTGLDVQWLPDEHWSARARVTNGWDVVQDPNHSKTGFARVGWTPDPVWSFAVAGYSGVEQPSGGTDRRSGGQLVFGCAHPRGTLQLQLDLGAEPGIDGHWWGVTAWEAWRVMPGTTLGLRGELIEDGGGTRTSGVLGYPVVDGQRLTSLTATLDVRNIPRAALRPELRLDHSDQPVFAGHHQQWSLALAMGFVY